MKQILIYNNHHFHYEIIETVMVKCRELLNLSNNMPIQIHIHTIGSDEFKKYIKIKYPTIRIGDCKNFDYSINCTIYDKEYNQLDRKPGSKCKYISHEITKRLTENPNVYFLTPLAKTNYLNANVLPFTEPKRVSDVPIYIIQGHIERRNLALLIKILDKKYDHYFMIKLLGKYSLPKSLEKYKDRIILKQNLNFVDYHKEFSSAYCILPLITKQSHPQYYSAKLTSSINYATGYNLKCIIDQDLQNIYQLKNVEVFNNIDDVTNAFEKSLNSFYTTGH